MKKTLTICRLMGALSMGAFALTVAPYSYAEDAVSSAITSTTPLLITADSSAGDISTTSVTINIKNYDGKRANGSTESIVMPVEGTGGSYTIEALVINSKIDSKAAVTVDISIGIDDAETSSYEDNYESTISNFTITGLYAHCYWDTDKGTIGASLGDMLEDSSIYVYKHFAEAEGVEHYGTLAGIVLDGVEAGAMGADIKAESTGGIQNVLGITSTSWLSITGTEEYGQWYSTSVNNKIGAITGSITLEAEDADLMIAVDAEKTDIDSISGAITVINYRVEALDNGTHEASHDYGSYGIYSDKDSSIGAVSSTISITGTNSQAVGIYSLGSIGDITGDITVTSTGVVAADGTTANGNNAWGVDIRNDEFGNIAANISVTAFMDATGVRIEGQSALAAVTVASSISGTITVASTYEATAEDGTGSVKYDSEAMHATGISLYDHSHVSTIDAEINVTANEADARGIVIYGDASDDTSIGMITSTITTYVASAETYTITSTAGLVEGDTHVTGHDYQYASVGILNYEESIILEIGDGASINATGAGDNYGINNNGSVGIMFSGDVEILTSGGVNNYALNANNNLTLMQSATSGDAANVTLQGDIVVTEKLTFDSGSYTLKSADSSKNILIDTGSHAGVDINQYTALADTNGVQKTGDATMVTLSDSADFDSSVLTFNITTDLTDVLMTIEDGADALNISTVQVVLSNDYYNSLTANGTEFDTLESMTFTVIGFEDVTDIATSALEKVTFSLMYYADDGSLKYYYDTDAAVAEYGSATIAIVDEEGNTFTVDSSTDLYGGNGSESSDITESVYSYYVGHYNFVAGASTYSIPEPSTATLSLLALAALLSRRKRSV